jgi:hypothetical protein
MKLIIALSSLALVSLSSIASCFAENQTLGRSSNQSSSQALPSAAKSFQVAGFGLGDVLRQVDRGFDLVEQEKRRKENRAHRAQIEQERQQQLEDQKKRQEKLQAARKADTEQQRLEADRRQKRYDSLSPAEKKAEQVKQRRQQEAANAAALSILGTLVTGSSGSAVPQQDDPYGDARQNQQRIDEQQEKARIRNSQPAPAPVDPIGGINGPYGGCHAVGC